MNKIGGVDDELLNDLQSKTYFSDAGTASQ